MEYVHEASVVGANQKHWIFRLPMQQLLRLWKCVLVVILMLSNYKTLSLRTILRTCRAVTRTINVPRHQKPSQARAFRQWLFGRRFFVWIIGFPFHLLSLFIYVLNSLAKHIHEHPPDVYENFGARQWALHIFMCHSRKKYEKNTVAPHFHAIQTYICIHINHFSLGTLHRLIVQYYIVVVPF